MQLQQRLDLLVWLGEYILSDDESWMNAKHIASLENTWYTPEFIELATRNIATQFLQKDKLQAWVQAYAIPVQNNAPKNIGIVMAGNIPLVGFHDFLCAFISGNKQNIKPSSKDGVLIKHLVQQMINRDAEVERLVTFAELLKGCDGYIATGSNNSARYFEYYFKKYPHIIRRNRTSAAILTDNETIADLERLADDVFLYFGLGCRNVTKIYVPEHYDFLPMLEAFKKYLHLIDHHKYKNNYDYQLAVLIINKLYYMTNGCIILHENKSLFSPISQLNYEFYSDEKTVLTSLKNNDEVQSIVGKKYIPFGNAQEPALSDYADGIDTLQFFLNLPKSVARN